MQIHRKLKGLMTRKMVVNTSRKEEGWVETMLVVVDAAPEEVGEAIVVASKKREVLVVADIPYLLPSMRVVRRRW